MSDTNEPPEENEPPAPPPPPPPGGGGYPPPPPPPPPQYGQSQYGQPQYGQQQQWAQPYPQAATGTIQSYLPHAIIATVLGLLCCLGIGSIPGVVGIVYAAQVRSKEQMGDIGGAESASRNAKLWSWIGLGIGILGFVIVVGLFLLGAILGEATTTTYP